MSSDPETAAPSAKTATGADAGASKKAAASTRKDDQITATATTAATTAAAAASGRSTGPAKTASVPTGDDDYLTRTVGDEGAAAAAYGVDRARPPTDPAPHADPHGAHGAEAHDHDRSGFATTALSAIVAVLAIAVLTLWLAPKLAPYLPAGVASWLQPGTSDLDDRVAGLEARLGDEQAAFEARLAEIEAERAALAASASSGETVAGDIERLSAELATLAGSLGSATDAEARAALESAGNELSAMANRADTLEADLGGIREELAAMADALAAAQDGEGPSSTELSTALAQVQSRVGTVAESVDAVRADLDKRVGELDQRLTAGLAAIETKLAEALSRADAADAARIDAEAQAERAAAAARRAEALAMLGEQMDRGEPYGDALAAAEEATGSAAPEPLAAKAGEGLATPSVLAEELSPVARQAVAAEIREDAGDDPVKRALSLVRSNLLSRPVAETEGDDVGAVLSRANARLAEGDAIAALAEVDALPETTREALGPWYDRLAARAAAERALADWRESAGSDS